MSRLAKSAYFSERGAGLGNKHTPPLCLFPAHSVMDLSVRVFPPALCFFLFPFPPFSLPLFARVGGRVGGGGGACAQKASMFCGGADNRSRNLRPSNNTPIRLSCV